LKSKKSENGVKGEKAEDGEEDSKEYRITNFEQGMKKERGKGKERISNVER
jgi:hypothetical protein